MATTTSTPARRRVLLTVALALVLAACGTATDDGAAGSTTSAPSTTLAPAEAAAGAFPVTVGGGHGPVELAEAPERIVSLSASLTELLFAIDAGEQVVAVDRFSDHPAGTPVTDLSGFKPNVEAIAGHEPDLVVLSSDREGVVGALGSLDIPALVLPAATSVDDVYAQIATLGLATGHPDEADALTASLRDDIDALVERVPTRTEPLTYYYEISDSFHTVTSDTFIGSLLAMAGLRSIADDAGDAAGGFPQLSAEAVVDADPDVIFVARSDAEVTPADVAARPGWGAMTAVAEERVVVLPDDVANRWGPRIVELLEEVVDATAEG